MKLVVGLGNPGPRYRGTRHNVGFEVVDELARRLDLEFESSPAAALMARERGPDARIMLAKPCTFMNLSGAAGSASWSAITGSRWRTCWWWPTT